MEPAAPFRRTPIGLWLARPGSGGSLRVSRPDRDRAAAELAEPGRFGESLNGQAVAASEAMKQACQENRAGGDAE